jgi:cytidine deaminase
MRLNNFNQVEALRETVFSNLDYAQANISGYRVAAAVFAMRKARKNKKKLETESSDLFKIFGGCNLEISVSTVLHAEAIALYKALSEGYTQVQAVGVTSDHEDQIKPLCGACRSHDNNIRIW